jgi:hypothetical protein
MSYTVRGLLNGERVTITWEDGVLSGDAVAVELLELRARALEGREVGPPTGPFTVRRHLANPLSTVFLIRALLGDEITASGEVPIPSPLPEDAVS